MKEEILNFLSTRPECIGVIGYGSGVIEQEGYSNTSSPQIDLILIVKDIKKWSLDNIEKNPTDYSYTGKLFFKNASTQSLKSGGKISYLTYIDYNDRKYKYGIIEEKDFLSSLFKWDTFYLAGRCQKNNLVVKSNEIIEDALYINRYNALILALFLNKNNDKLTEFELYKTICSLSYMGDSRQGIGENPHKIDNILKKDFLNFRNIYSVYNLYEISESGIIKVKLSEADLSYLPDCITNEIKKLETYDEQVKRIIEIISTKNRNESLAQTFKGIFTAGFVNSANYGIEKIKKAKSKHN